MDEGWHAQAIQITYVHSLGLPSFLHLRLSKTTSSYPRHPKSNYNSFLFKMVISFQN